VIAMKVYDFQWRAIYGMDAAEAADALAGDGVDTVLLANRIDPLPSSGVDQEAYLSRGSGMDGHEDRAWAQALRAAGLGVYQTTATFFDPAALREFPDARPIDAEGNPDRGFDWYLGICPTHEGYLAAKTERLRQVVQQLEPDGMFLSFTRYPGFWENWVPGYRFSTADRFCFCPRCLDRFSREAMVALPTGGTALRASHILENHGRQWTAWRCGVIAGAVAGIADELRQIRPDLPVMLNTIAFPAPDFGGLDVRREIVAQDLGLLAETVSRFELMTYLQILDRPDSWLEEVVADARRSAPDSELLCTLQVAPLYTGGIHSGRGRRESITADDLERSARAALAAGADGLVFYHWTDFLDDAAAGGRKRDVLRSLARG
jgi:hypothetical protein